MKNKFWIIFSFIIFIGFILRFYELGNVPNSLNWDEVSWGYNAYSIVETGKDEYGRILPLSFEAFGDFKQPVYVYLASISVKLFGLETFGVRLPSALLGVLTIPFVYLLVSRLFSQEKYAQKLALISMLLFSIAPWSIQFSRVAYEANIGLFFTIAGSAIFLHGLSGKRLYLYLSVVPLVLSTYSYHSQKIFTPLLFAFLLFYALKIHKLKKKVLIILFTLFILGCSLWLLDPRTTQRGRSVTIFSNQLQVLKSSADNISQSETKKDLLGIALNNRRIVYFHKYVENYLSHFNLNYLFVKGDNARHHAFGTGVLLLVSLPTIILGLFALNKRKYWLLLVWFFLAPVASAFAVDAPNSSRSLVILPTWQIFEALGIVFLLSLKKKFYFCLVLVFFTANYFYYLHQYFVHTNPQYGIYWQDGYRESIEAVNRYSKSEKNIFVSGSFEQPYIFYLFYNKYSPAIYQKNGGSDRIKSQCFSINNVYFGKCMENAKSGDYYIEYGEVLIKNVKKLDDIKSKEGKIIGSINEFM